MICHHFPSSFALRIVLGGLVLALAGTQTPAHGQISTPLRVEYELSNPGARSLGFGGAFAALADDATAAYANPAGLSQLVESEVSLELRVWDRSVPFLAGGRVDGVPTGRGIDTVDGPIEGRSSIDSSNLSFASYVLPKRRWALALYHHQLASFEVSTESQGQFFDFFPGVPLRFPATRDRVDLDLTATGAALSLKLGDAWSLGVGLVNVDGSATARSELYFPFDGDTIDSLFERIEFRPDQLTGLFTTRVDDSAIAGRLGVLWRPSERWSAGAFYRQGPTLDGITSRTLLLPFDDDDEPFEVTEPSQLDVPDVYGIGVAYRSVDGRLTLSSEVDSVEIGSIFRFEGAEDEDLEDSASATGTYLEAHLGAEYVVMASRFLVALRAGTWYDERPPGFTDLEEPDSTQHFSLGVGLAFDRLQVDVGVDLSEVTDTLALSMIYSF